MKTPVNKDTFRFVLIILVTAAVLLHGGEAAAKVETVQAPKKVEISINMEGVLLQWDEPDLFGLRGYEIYRADSEGGEYIKIATVDDCDGKVCKYIDKVNIDREFIYFYKVKAVCISRRYIIEASNVANAMLNRKDWALDLRLDVKNGESGEAGSAFKVTLVNNEDREMKLCEPSLASGTLSIYADTPSGETWRLSMVRMTEAGFLPRYSVSGAEFVNVPPRGTLSAEYRLAFSNAADPNAIWYGKLKAKNSIEDSHVAMMLSYAEDGEYAVHAEYSCGVPGNGTEWVDIVSRPAMFKFMLKDGITTATDKLKVSLIPVDLPDYFKKRTVSNSTFALVIKNVSKEYVTITSKTYTLYCCSIVNDKGKELVRNRYPQYDFMRVYSVSIGPGESFQGLTTWFSHSVNKHLRNKSKYEMRCTFSAYENGSITDVNISAPFEVE